MLRHPRYAPYFDDEPKALTWRMLACVICDSQVTLDPILQEQNRLWVIANINWGDTNDVGPWMA